METYSGIGRAIELIQEKAEEALEPVIMEIDGQNFSKTRLHHISKVIPKQETINLYNLDGLIEMVKNAVRMEKSLLPLKLIVSEQRVVVLSEVDQNKEFETLFISKSQHPDIIFNSFIEVERMIIQLQTCFEDTDNKTALIKVISQLSRKQSVETADDGISQKVTFSKGVDIKEKAVINPLVKLIPIRSFHEIISPDQNFLLRINNDGHVALIDASGDHWKNSVQVEIRKYLNEHLEKLVQDQKIVIA